MKIILSRKGFDSGYGGVPSPVFPDGRLLSLPIPSPAGLPAQACRFEGQTFGDIVQDLTAGKLSAATLVHLDPDLEASAIPRRPGWRPAFGQVGAAQAHLRNQGVGAGDLFLFFGWFQRVSRQVGAWRRIPEEPWFHALFGWLQVDQLIDVEATPVAVQPQWLTDHPHIAHAPRFAGEGNTIYVGRRHLSLGSTVGPTCGGGAFKRWSPALRLTSRGQTRSVWSVPTWLEPHGGRTPLSYHGKPERWIKRGDELLLRSVAKGQEFVLDTDDYPEAIAWARNLIEEHS